jgi:hypothetical protein
MKKFIIDELKKRSCIPGKQRTWIADLTDDQLYELFKRLRNGQKAKPIARYIQKKWGIRTNSSAHSLSQAVLKFRKRIEPLLNTTLLEKDKFLQPASQDLVNRDDLGSLERNELIAKRLRDRIDGMIKEEKETGITFPYLSRDVQALTALEKMIVQQKDWELKHPDGGPVRLRELERKDRKIDSLFNTYMEKTTEDDRDRTIKFLELIVEKLDEHSVPVKKDQDGNWFFPERENDR